MLRLVEFLQGFGDINIFGAMYMRLLSRCLKGL